MRGSGRGSSTADPRPGTGKTFNFTLPAPAAGPDRAVDPLHVHQQRAQTRRDEVGVAGLDDPVTEGQVITYTLTFNNIGRPARHRQLHGQPRGVLDDATVTTQPVVAPVRV